jgi:ribosomal protein S18 acetylase RimI-like enzyme
MGSGYRLVPARTVDDFAAVARLFAAYSAALGVDLSYQDFGAELASLPGEYAPPDGELLLVRSADDEPLGCVALRRLGESGACEMKRLYVVPSCRGHGLGRALVEGIVARARSLGYREMRLDTLPGMAEAQAMYRAAGFEAIAPYYDTPIAGTVFLRLVLAG